LARYGKEYHAACKSNQLNAVNEKVTSNGDAMLIIPISTSLTQSIYFMFSSSSNPSE